MRNAIAEKLNENPVIAAAVCAVGAAIACRGLEKPKNISAVWRP